MARLTLLIATLGIGMVLTLGTLWALGVDLPFLTATQLTRIKDLTGAACGVLPQIRARSEPLAAIYPREGSPYFVRALRGDDFSLQAITRQMIDAGLLRLFDVPQTQEQLYRNVNVPADLPMSADLKQAMSDIGC